MSYFVTYAFSSISISEIKTAETITVAKRHKMFNSHRAHEGEGLIQSFSIRRGYGDAFPPSARGTANFNKKEMIIPIITHYIKFSCSVFS